MAARKRVERQSVFILNRRPYSESSLLLDAFSRDHGRMMLLAKGARRLKSPHRGLLHCFHALTVDWSGSRDLKTLTRAESETPAHRLPGAGFLCACYANELLMRMMHRGDPHEELFDAYRTLLAALQRREERAWALRVFEKRLLSAVGYGLVLDRDATTNRPIREDRVYAYVFDHGPVADDRSDAASFEISGTCLKALDSEIRPHDSAQRELKRLTRRALAVHLDGVELKSRSVFRQLRGLGLRI